MSLFDPGDPGNSDDPGAELSCEQAELLISRHLDRELRDTDAARLDAHLSSCRACRDTLGDWRETSRAVSSSLGALWARPHEKPIGRNETRIRGLARPGAAGRTRKKTKAGLWFPLGMVASQCAAFLLLGIYYLFWPQRVEAPYVAAQPESSPPPARHSNAPPHPIQIAQLAQAAQAEGSFDASVHGIQSANAASVPVSASFSSAAVAGAPDGPAVAGPRAMFSLCDEMRPVAQWPGTAPWRGDRVAGDTVETVVLASFDRPARNLEVVDNVGSSFRIETPEGGTESGTLALLADRASGEMYVRITGADSRPREIAPGEIESLDPALRSIVRRLLESYGQRR